ncbi:MAG: putative capsid protein [Circoviridae sp.]|nr:MAG: putative capsid protein [Circoviridae sp.]
MFSNLDQHSLGIQICPNPNYHYIITERNIIMAKTKKNVPLTKTQKSEVKVIAKNAVKNEAEKKYMNCARILSVRPYRANTPGNIGVIAFSNSVSTVSDGTQLHYGIADGTGAPEPIKELKMMRPYVGLTGDAQTDNYAIEGRECKPSSARVKWRMSRDIGDAVALAGTVPTLNPPNLATNLPVIVRMIRVNPKVGQNNIRCDPEEDLFLTEYNNNIGINSSNFDETELLMYRVNKRRYNVIEDKFFRIQNALTLQYQLSFRPSDSNSYYAPQISNTNANCEKLYQTNHMLTSKKGGSLFYDTPDVSTLEAPSSGHKREYIFYHMVYAGAETFLTRDGGSPTYPSDLLLTASPMVKFTDV